MQDWIQIVVNLTDVVYHLVAAVALIVGGGWAYFKFIKNRTFKPRLAVRVEGRVITGSEGQDTRGSSAASATPRLVVRCGAENVGLREVKIGEEGTALRIYFHGVESGGSGERATLADWQWLDSWPVFESRYSLEPDEPVEEQLLIELPRKGFAALRLELVVHSPPGNAWEVSEVVVIRTEEDNIG